METRTGQAGTALARAETLSPIGTLIVGGGPAGMALLLAASRGEGLGHLLEGGLAVAERTDEFGAGALGGYAITSDSTADTFLTSVRDHRLPSLARLAERPEAAALSAQGGNQGVKLTIVGDFLRLLGAGLAQLVEQGGGTVLGGHEALHARQTSTGWITTLRRLADGAMVSIPSRNLVIATGGEQARARVGATVVEGRTLADRAGSRLVGSDAILALGGLARLEALVRDAAEPRIAILGGSTSAVTAANLILNSPLGARLGPGGLALMHRRALRPFYPSAEAALADGFTTFGAHDICPLSGFVYRLAGFRTEARALVLAALGIGGRTPDPRLRLHTIGETPCGPIFDQADAVIGAIGYRPRGLILLDPGGVPILRGADPMVDGSCRIRDASGHTLAGLFGIGLAAGFVPSGALGGEPSFSGQANGLWLWQNAVGDMITDQLRDRLPRLQQAGQPLRLAA